MSVSLCACQLIMGEDLSALIGMGMQLLNLLPGIQVEPDWVLLCCMQMCACYCNYYYTYTAGTFTIPSAGYHSNHLQPSLQLVTTATFSHPFNW